MTDEEKQPEPQEKPQPRRTRKNQKVRKDKGRVYATERDIEVLTWIAEQDAVRFEQVQRLLSRKPGAPTKGRLLSAATTQDQIDRWVRAGWAVSYRFLADQASWVCVTRGGLALVELADTFRARIPSPKRLDHIWAVSQVRLMVESNKEVLEKGGYEWIAERYLLANEEDAEREAKQKKKQYTWHPVPDASLEGDEYWIAIEVELTPKKPAELLSKLKRLCEWREWGDEGAYDIYDRIWFYVPDEKMRDHVERQRVKLIESYQKRVEVTIANTPLLFTTKAEKKPVKKKSLA